MEGRKGFADRDSPAGGADCGALLGTFLTVEITGFAFGAAVSDVLAPGRAAAGRTCTPRAGDTTPAGRDVTAPGGVLFAAGAACSFAGCTGGGGATLFRAAALISARDRVKDCLDTGASGRFTAFGGADGRASADLEGPAVPADAPFGAAGVEIPSSPRKYARTLSADS